MLRPMNTEDMEKKHIRLLSGYVDALLGLIQVLRSNEYELQDVNGRTSLVFAIVSGNTYLMSKQSTSDTAGIPTDYRKVLQLFVDNRIEDFLTKSLQVLWGSMSHMLGDVERRPTPNLSISEMELLECEVINLCERTEKYRPNDHHDHVLETNHTGDVISTFMNMISRYSNHANRLRGQNSSKLGHTQDDSKADYSSLRSLLLLGYLAVRSARAIIISHHGFDYDYAKDRSELDREVALSSYTNLSNLGSMSLNNMMCCWVNRKLFRSVIENPKGSLGYAEKIALRNGLVVSRLATQLAHMPM